MLLVYFLLSLFYFNCESEDIFSYEEQLREHGLITCVTEIVEKYFAEEKSLTYVDMENGNDEILKELHYKKITTLRILQYGENYRKVSKQQHFRHQGYLITAKTVTKFTESFNYLLQESMWNPFARFVIVINSLEEDKLKNIFDELLKRLVINVIVINGTKDAGIYTYNPYENYGCGKYYDTVKSYGLCSNKHENLFPNKLVTGLKNCSLDAMVGNHPPYAFHSSKSSIKIPGTEQYIFQILAEIEEFNLNFTYVNNRGLFTIIDENMKVSGPMVKLQNNETDVMFGGKVLVSRRADAFTYLHGHLDFDDEMNFLVKRASFKAIWKNIYLEFQTYVWCLLLMVFLLYSIIMVLLLRTEDKSEIILKLLNAILLHGSKIPERTTAQFFFIIWVWFAYLMNSIYQSSLVSLTSNPIMDRQISTEHALAKHKLKPCVGSSLQALIQETNFSAPLNTECMDDVENVKIIAKSEDMYTLVQKSLFHYHKKVYCDEFGHSPFYSFKKPYAKIVFGYFFRKGFPVSDRMRRNVVRLRETGLVAKSLKDHYYARKIKHHFRKRGFEMRFVMPWRMYMIGCAVASVVFIFELFSARYKKYFC